jgi:hypothetical protein
MVAITKVGRTPRLMADYDRHADVLYLTLGQPVSDEGEDRPRGIVLRFAVKNDTPSGVTVIGFSRNNWPSHVLELSSIVSQHLRIDPLEVDRAINRILK